MHTDNNRSVATTRLPPARSLWCFCYPCLLIVVFLMIESCMKELDLSFPQAEEQIVLNGILHPDSIIQVSVTKTLPVNSFDRNYPLVKDAEVRIYEDDKLLGNLIYQDSIHILDYYPKAGSEYRVEVKVSGFPVVSATDVIPAPPNAEVCFLEDSTKGFFYSFAYYDININDPDNEANFYWFYTWSNSLHGSKCKLKLDSVVWENGELQYIPQDTIVCSNGATPVFGIGRGYEYGSFSSVPDRFNAYVDNTSGGVTKYEGYIRVEDNGLNGELISFAISGGQYDYLRRYQGIDEQLSVKANIINASQAYDRYLKSSITYFLNENLYDDEDIGLKPFVESSEVYSNVENGTGIFAAYNSVDIEVGDFPNEQ